MLQGVNLNQLSFENKALEIKIQIL